MENIDVTINENFWPSGYGVPIVIVANDLEDVSKILFAPVFTENEGAFVMIRIPGIGVCTIIEDLESGNQMMVIDGSLDHMEAARKINSALAGRLDIIWPEHVRENINSP